MEAEAVTSCKHCGRTIVMDDQLGMWVDPNATGDDLIWRETCDSHDTFVADHEPDIVPGWEQEWLDHRACWELEMVGTAGLWVDECQMDCLDTMGAEAFLRWYRDGAR